MKLRKQLFTAFLTVAILPLIIVGVFIFATNLMLAFDLHEQNLRDSTQIQADLVDDNINRLMVRARKFTLSPAVQSACQSSSVHSGDATAELSSDILNFTNETLDNVAVFALLDENGEFLYTSGSNSDSVTLKENLQPPLVVDSQSISEIQFTDKSKSLIIYTPVQKDGKTIGSFLMVCRTDYLLKLISSHRQLESSNALIYCQEHHRIVSYKQLVSGTLCELEQKLDGAGQGFMLCKIDGQTTLTYYQGISKTPWVLVSTVSVRQIFSQVWNYGLINIAALLVVFMIILFISRRQSRRVLYPMDQLLGAVEEFFLGGATKFPQADIDPKSEIGYLAEKFVRLSEESALTQGKLKESNYLYAALLKATYEFRIVLDFYSGTVECSSGSLKERLNGMDGKTGAERLLKFLALEDHDIGEESDLYHIICGKRTDPMEAEAYFSKKEDGEKKWYRVVAVPVIQGCKIWRVVLHFEDISKQKREEQRLIESSQTDQLCGIYNKTAFPLHCKLSEDGKTDAMFFIDLDKFKQVNDTLGHSAGDNVLVSTAHAIRAQFRDSDVVGRFGGDEFVVFAPGISRTMAEQKARRLLETLSFYLDTPKETEIHVTASVGICMTAPPATLESAIELADEAMYQAKENGRARYSVVDSDHKK